jgi:hypothetical protein
MAAEFDSIEFDLRAMLAHLTRIPKEKWIEKSGPDSGSGLDYWYETAAGIEAYINVDQTAVSISVYDENGETLEQDSFDLEDEEFSSGHWAAGMVLRHAGAPSP